MARGNIDSAQIKAADIAGNGTKFQMSGGGQTYAGDMAVFDANGNVVDGGPPGTGGGTGSGTVTSVGLAAPPEFTVTGSPITSAGTLTLAKANQSASQVYAGPSSGAAAAPVFRALVATDIPPIPESGVTGLTADLAAKAPTARLINTTLPLTGGGDLSANRTLAINTMTGDTGTGGARGVVPAPAAGDAAAGHFLKADGTWAAPSSGGGSVTSVGLTMPVEFNVSGSPVTAAGTLAVTKATEPANTVYAGPAASGSAALIQHTSHFLTGSTSNSLAYPSANTAGNLLLACIWCRSSPVSPTVTDTAGNTWTKAVGWTGGVLTSIWYAYSAAGGPNTVTYSDSGTANNIHLVIEEVSGIVPSGLDQSGSVTSSLTVTTAGSVSQANEWVVGAMGGCCGSVVNPIVPPATSTQDDLTYDSSYVERITVAHLTATTGLSGSQSMAFTSSGSNGTFLWGCIATFKAGGAGLAPTFRALVAADMPTTGAGSGTVTSVGFNAPSEFTISGSPVTSAGTIALSKANQTGNTVWASPANGSAGQPTFRNLVAADIPALPESQITNLVSDLAAKAPLASPALTGTPTAPTPTAADNSTNVATTAFVKTALTSGAYRLNRVFVITVSQTYTPTTGTRALYVEAVGGGGGGGSAKATSSNLSVGGAGGGGGYSASWLTSPASSYVVTLGGGGSAGSGGSGGGTGGPTSFGSNPVANGGVGGSAGSTAGTAAVNVGGGAGGAAGTGDFTLPGGYGGQSGVLSSTAAILGGGGGSVWGSPSGIVILTTGTTGGYPAVVYGSGGGGSGNSGTQAALNGQPGAQGAVRIWEFV